MSANTVLPCATQRSLEKVLCVHSTLQRNATRSRRSKRCCVYTVLPCATQRSLEKVLCVHSTLQRDATVSRKSAVLTQYSPARRNGLSKRCCAYTVLSSATQRSLEKVLCVHSTLQRDATVSRKGAVLTQYSAAQRDTLASVEKALCLHSTPQRDRARSSSMGIDAAQTGAERLAPVPGIHPGRDDTVFQCEDAQLFASPRAKMLAT